MAHIPYTYTPLKGNSSKLASFSPALAGVRLSDNRDKMSNDKCCQMYNFDVLSDRIATRNAEKLLFSNFPPEGVLHGISREQFCGKTIFHVGKNLYCYDGGENEPALLSSDLPDKDSLFCPFLSKLYIYCDRHIFSVNNAFEFAEEEPFAPVLYENLAPTNTSPKLLDVPYNMLAPRIEAQYRLSESLSFVLPVEADLSRKVEIYEDDVLVDPSICTIEEKLVYIYHSKYVDSRVVKIVYYVKNDSDIGYDGFIAGCRVAASFGGDVNGGTRLFFTGNDEKKGHYYKSELQNPLFVPSDEYEILGNGSENVTCLKRMYGDLMVFTQRSVFRMAYNLSNDGPVFTVKEISSGIGCDCPDSIQLVDNRVVFLNSEKGVFIVDSTENTGEQNVKPISKNVLKGNGTGILDNDKNSLENAWSVDFDRKYMLFIGSKAYIWDYDESGFVDTGNYSKAQERLIWYIYDGISGEVFFETRSGLACITKHNVQLYGFDKSMDKSDVVCRYVSGIVSEMYPFSKKFVTDVSLMLKKNVNSAYTLSLYADGKKYYEVVLPQGQGGKEKIILKLPKKELYGFGYEISGSGEIEIEHMLFDYTIIKD